MYKRQVISGMRTSSNIYIYLKLGENMLETLKIVKSLNGVFLTEEDIKLNMFEKVVIMENKVKGDGTDLDSLLLLLVEKNIPYECIK